MKVHFVGIGGIGISALARYFLSEGASVSGSDATSSELTDELQKEGVSIRIGHDEHNVPPGAELVVYSPAVRPNNPELKFARALKIKIQSYPQALGELTRKYFTIAVSGSHGKSTTTSLLALILMRAGLDPTVIVGTKLKELASLERGGYASNFRKGESSPPHLCSSHCIGTPSRAKGKPQFSKDLNCAFYRCGGKYLVIEADEWNKSFWHYRPQVAVVTNIDKEHLDTYASFRGVVAGFARYLKNVPKGGTLVLNWRDKELRKLGAKAGKSRNVVFYNKSSFKKHPLLIPGRHNQINAEAAWTAAKLLGVKKEAADYVFRTFSGAWRRMELLASGQVPSMSHVPGSMLHVYSDYAHHPTEIRATLQALREKHRRERIICVFQPHHQDRLTKLFKEFTGAFKEADITVILPVYKVKGRDEVYRGKDSFGLAQTVRDRQKNVFYAENLEAAMKTIKPFLDKNTVIVFMSAGDLDSQVRKFLTEYY